MKLRWFVNSSLRRQLSLSLILLIIGVATTIGITSIKIAQQVIREHTARFGGKMLSQAAYRLGSVIDSAETTVDSLIIDRRLAPLLDNLSAVDPKIKEVSELALRELLIQYKASLLPGAELMVIDTSGNMVTTYHLQPTPKKLFSKNLSDKTKIWRLRYQPFYKNSDLRVSGRLLQLTARIISLPGQSQDGWIILDMDYRIVESIMTNISLQENSLSRFQSEAVVYGPNRQIIFPWVAPADKIFARAYQKFSGHLRDTETFEETVNGKKHLVIATPVPWTSWEVYISAPAKRLYAGLEQIYSSVFVIGLICMLIAILAATLISFLVTKPVNKLRKVMRSVEEGNFLVSAPEGGPLEMQTLGRAFNRMLRELDVLTKRLVAEESDRKTAVIKALQAQIAPHFLFNTLAAMAGMTLKRPPEEVAEALRSLKRLLYLSIGKKGDFVTLADEFEHIHHYLYLMNIRYPGKFLLKIELPEELRLCRTIRLILQPIVENCLQHGFKWQGGEIRLLAYRENNDVIIEIADNGGGMPSDQILIAWNDTPGHSGIGVRNVDERIKLSFGRKYGLTINSIKGEGTRVFLRIPYQYSDSPVIASDIELKEQI